MGQPARNHRKLDDYQSQRYAYGGESDPRIVRCLAERVSERKQGKERMPFPIRDFNPQADSKSATVVKTARHIRRVCPKDSDTAGSPVSLQDASIFRRSW